jgi:tetratricopeptide (TPR) repeat protein
MQIPVRVSALAVFALLGTAPLALAQGAGAGMHAGDSLQKGKPAGWRGKAQISGKITDEAGKGVPEAKVTFIFVSSNDGFFATAKKNGEFSAKDIQAGAWRVQIEAPNFVTVRRELTVVESKNPVIDVHLKRDNSPELLAKAEGLFKAGQLAEARTEYLKVLEAHPELTAINRAIAFTYGREKNNAEALKYLDLALAGNPNDPVLLQLAAVSAIELSEYPRALEYLAKIDDGTISDPEILLNTAMNLLNRRRSAEATAVLDRVIARFPENPDAYFYRGYAKMQASKAADARPDLEKYLALAPAGAQAEQAKTMLASIK